MRVIIKPDYDTVSKWVANYVVYRINKFRPTPEHLFVLGLPTGGTPLGMYKELINLYQKRKVSFENVATFNMDEYLGLPPTDPQSYRYFMEENFFKHINIKPQNIHMLNGLTKDYEKECLNYEKAIKSLGGVNLFIGGVGTDGHIAFNEPFSSLSSRTRVKTLTESTRQANARFFGGKVENVPFNAITVGVGTIMDSAEVMIIITGKNKAEALKHAIEGPVSHVWTVSALQMHPQGLIVCDEEATSDLSPETVAYFKDIEKNNF